MCLFRECGQVSGVDGVATALWFAVGLCTRAVKGPPLSWFDVVLAGTPLSVRICLALMPQRERGNLKQNQARRRSRSATH